jgi:tetratricopeptide (TPR) repeat protein
MDSTEPNIYFEYGKALFAEQKYQESLEKFLKSIELGQLNIGVYIYAGISYYYLQDYQNGIDIITKSIDKDSSIKSAYLWRANNYVGLSKNPEACADYKKYLEYEPDDQFAKDQVQRLCEPK